ncbi:MAG: ABC transporter permease [Eubacterium sp.]|nr:ABC transporter permease [Eubacterium sp.]
MIRYLIKNNLKIMFRSAVNIIMYVLCPIIVSAVIMSAFSAVMESYEGPEEFVAGYSFTTGSQSSEYQEVLMKIGQENGITFKEYDGDIEEGIHDNDLGGFVEIKKDSYKVYKSEDKAVEGAKLEYLMSAFFNSMISADGADIQYTIETPDYEPAIDSTDYYGIIYIVYFGWCAIVCGAGLFTSEKKNSIIERLQVSNLSTFQIYLARLIPIVIVVFFGTGISAVVSSLMLGVHWGNILISGAIVLLTVTAATAFEMMIYEMTNSMIATIILSFGIVWFMGFVGGTFEAYVFSDMPEAVKSLSPLYHVNRSLTELSSMGHSSYVLSSILYSVGLIVGCSGVSLIVGKIRRAGK